MSSLSADTRPTMSSAPRGVTHAACYCLRRCVCGACPAHTAAVTARARGSVARNMRECVYTRNTHSIYAPLPLRYMWPFFYFLRFVVFFAVARAPAPPSPVSTSTPAQNFEGLIRHRPPLLYPLDVRAARAAGRETHVTHAVSRRRATARGGPRRTGTDDRCAFASRRGLCVWPRAAASDGAAPTPPHFSTTPYS